MRKINNNRTSIRVDGKRKKKISVDWSLIARKALFFLSLVIFLIAATWVLFFSDFMKVEKFSVFGIDKIDENNIRKTFSDRLAEKYFNFLPAGNLIILPKERMISAAKQQNIWLKEVVISRKFPNEADIHVKERVFIALWCSGDNCFWVDESGQAFAEKDKFDLEREFPKIIDQTNHAIRVEEKVATEDMIVFASQIGEAVGLKTDINLLKEFSTPAEMSGELRAKTEAGWEIYFRTDQGAEREAELLSRLISDKIGKDNLDKIEYIDLRLKGKAVYKMKKIETENEADNESDGSKEGNKTGDGNENKQG